MSKLIKRGQTLAMTNTLGERYQYGDKGQLQAPSNTPTAVASTTRTLPNKAKSLKYKLGISAMLEYTAIASTWATLAWQLRVAYYENGADASSAGSRIHYRYDSRGNRTGSFDEKTGRKMELSWNKGNQLVQVVVQEEGKHFTQSYHHDAFGRRLAKYNDPGNSATAKESGTDYWGWDGDRLVHTKRFGGSDTGSNTDGPKPEVIHTMYEPGSFTPLVQLRQTSKPAPGIAEELLSHTPPGVVQESLRSTLANFESMAAQISERLNHVGMAADAQSFIQAQLGQMLREQKQHASQSVEMRQKAIQRLMPIGDEPKMVNVRRIMIGVRGVLLYLGAQV